MKKFILSLLVFTSAFNSFAQHTALSEIQELIPALKIGNIQIDTFLFEYRKKNTKIHYNYDSAGNITGTSVYTWEDTNNKWIIDQTEQLEYDKRHNLILYHNKNEKSNSKTRIESIYDKNNNQISRISYFWDTHSGEWTGTEKVKRTYNGDKFTSYSSYSWENGSKEWKLWEKSNYIYDVYKKGNITSELEFRNDWDRETNTWNKAYISKIERYNKKNLVVEVRYYGTKDQKWQPKDSIEFVTYKKENRLDKNYYSYSKENRKWKEISKTTTIYNKKNQPSVVIDGWSDKLNKTEYTYTSADSITLESTYFYKPDTDQWEKIEEKENIYNQQGQIISQLYCFYEGDEIFPVRKTEFRYDNDGQKTQEAKYFMNSDGNWETEEKTELCYKEENLLVVDYYQGEDKVISLKFYYSPK